MPLSVAFMDGAEHYTRQDRKWKFAGTNSTAPASGVAGAHGLVHDDSSWGFKRHSFTATPKSSIRFRIRFRVDTEHTFLHAQSNSSNTHVQLRRNSDGTITVLRPPTLSAGETTVDTYAIDTWYEMEFRLSIGNGGSYLLKINGLIPEKDGGGFMALSADTQLGSDDFMISWCLGSATLDTYTDDVVIDLAKGNLGTGQVETAWPNGAGDLAGLSPSTIAPNWTLVDEAIEDDLTSYVESTGENQRDCYAFPAVGISGSKFVVQACGMVTHGASGNPTFHFRFFLRIDGENYDGAVQHNATTTFECFQECWSTNPATGDDWTETEINDTQVGILCEEEDILMTQLVREVAALTPTPDFAGFRNYCGSIDTDIN